jgi:hypothetical protein
VTDRDEQASQPIEDDGRDAPSDPRGSLVSRGCGWIGCLLVIGILVALGAGAYALGNALEPLADRFLWAPHDVVREYLDAWRREDTRRAERFLCAGTDELLDPLQPLGSRVGAPYVDDEFPYPRGGGRVAIYYRAELRGPRAQALLEREDDGWRICELVP